MSDTNAASSSNALCAITVDMPVAMDARVPAKRGRIKAELNMFQVGRLVHCYYVGLACARAADVVRLCIFW